MSDLFRKSLAYARAIQPSSIFILSAKYGVIAPQDEIEPYDVTLNTMSVTDVQGWSERVIEQLRRRTDFQRDHFVILAGDRYRRYLVPHLRSVEVPLAGLSIGQQLSWLKKRLS